MDRRLALTPLLLCWVGCGGVNCPSEVSPTGDFSGTGTPESAVPLHVNGKATTWNWQLTGTLNTTYSVDVYDVDLFETTAAQITALKGDGKTVVCYFSAGSSENWRPDFEEYLTTDLGSTLDGWKGERWLDIRSASVQAVIEGRLDLAVSKGCDGVEPDNMDGYTNDRCFGLTSDDQLQFNRWIANEARARGLSVALKNDPDQVSELEPYFDFSVTEQCFQYQECDAYQPFLDANKPVLNAEYARRFRSDPDRAQLCADSATAEIQTLVLSLDLNDSYRYACF